MLSPVSMFTPYCDTGVTFIDCALVKAASSFSRHGGEGLQTSLLKPFDSALPREVISTEEVPDG